VLVAVFLALLTLFYLFLISFLIVYWNRITVFRIPDTFIPKTKISIVVPVRNEAAHLASCIESLLNQEYPRDLCEILIVDDQSYDETPDIAAAFDDSRIQYMRLGVEGRTTIEGSKKKAIAYGVNHAKGTLIVTTDGDCTLPVRWLKSIAAQYEQDAVRLLAGAVIPTRYRNWLEAFISLDMMNTFVIQAAGVKSGSYFICSGANLAYERKAFIESEPYNTNLHIASGDDIFLIDKFKTRYPGQLAILKSNEAVCLTEPPADLASFFNQRLRWAGKMKKTSGTATILLATFIWLHRIIPMAALIIGLLLHDNLYIFSGTIAIGIGWLLDFAMLYQAVSFFGSNKLLYWFIPSEIFYTIYFFILGVLSWLPVQLEWKDRRLSI